MATQDDDQNQNLSIKDYDLLLDPMEIIFREINGVLLLFHLPL